MFFLPYCSYDEKRLTEKQIYFMRTYGLVPGDFLDRALLLSAKADETGGPLFHLDVSHLWNGGLFLSSVKTFEKQMRMGPGPRLYGQYFCGRIYHRKSVEKA